MAPAYEYQWKVTIEFWNEFIAHCKKCGIEHIAIEEFPGTMVWSASTLLKLREATDPMLGINLDPSHMMWQTEKNSFHRDRKAHRRSFQQGDRRRNGVRQGARQRKRRDPVAHLRHLAAASAMSSAMDRTASTPFRRFCTCARPCFACKKVIYF